MLELEVSDIADAAERSGIPWRAIWRLAAGTRTELGAMVALSLVGSACGLVPSLGLGFFVNSLVRQSRTNALLWLGAIGISMLVESGAYLLSDGLYGRVAARLYRDLRVVMFDGVLRRRLSGERRAALSSRFVSDAESMEDLTVAVLDQGAISVFDLTAALVVLALLDGWLLGVIAGALAVSAVVTSRLRRPAAAAGERRQEALELMSDELSRSGSARPDASRRRFRDVVEAVSASELRLGWIGAANRQGSQALASLGQVVVLLAAFLDGGLAPGTLLSVYLLAGRALGATETLLDARFEIELARGSVARCFALADVV